LEVGKKEIIKGEVEVTLENIKSKIDKHIG